MFIFMVIKTLYNSAGSLLGSFCNSVRAQSTLTRKEFTSVMLHSSALSPRRVFFVKAHESDVEVEITIGSQDDGICDTALAAQLPEKCSHNFLPHVKDR